MARLNISIPDALHARLDQLRDRVNASKVCASALEKELDMVEGAATSTADPGLVNRLVDRLQQQQSESDRWYQRGRQEGEAWALETAGLEELRHIEQWSWLLDLPDVEKVNRTVHKMRRAIPESFQGSVVLDQESISGDANLQVAYLKGWFAAVSDIWKAAKPRLQSHQPSREVAHPDPRDMAHPDPRDMAHPDPRDMAHPGPEGMLPPQPPPPRY